MKFWKIGLVTFIAIAGCSTSSEYIFRNQDRPTFDKAIGVDELGALSTADNVTLLDVRLLEDFAANPVLIPGATYKDPEKIDQWFSSISKDSKVIVYCVKGKWVSQKAASFLSEKGFDSYTLTGGIQEWQGMTEN